MEIQQSKNQNNTVFEELATYLVEQCYRYKETKKFSMDYSMSLRS